MMPLSYIKGRNSVRVLAAAFLVWTAASVQAQEHQIAARPLTHQEIADYSLPEGAHSSGGLHVVGIGESIYMEALVIKGTQVADVTWELTSKPLLSSATLTESILGPEIPTYEVADQRDYDVAARQTLVPDVVGKYLVTATVSLVGGGEAVLTKEFTGATYVGVGGQDGEEAEYPQCALCHQYDFFPGGDKVSAWAETGHATMFTEAIDGLKSDHYNEGCIECHVLGFNHNAVNGGFDDVAEETGWTFPTELVPGNWAAMPNELKEVSNIQCENCHGAGSEHHGDISATAVTYNSGNCSVCHEEQPYHVKNLEWKNSKHAIAVREERTSCAGCHQGIGFADRMKGMDPVRTEYAAITCAACHEPHDATNPHQVRSTADVTLNDTSKPGGPTVVTEGGTGKLCMQCHISRRDAVSYAEEYHSRFGPHHGPQTDMFVGANAITYGKDIPSSAHLYAIEDSCAACHAVATSRNSPEHLLAGGHTFQPRWDGGTPDDPSDDVDLVNACSSCHGPIVSFNFPREDYDGDGVLEGVQTEVEGLMHELAMMLPPIGEPTVNVTPAYAPHELKGAYNYLMVEEDGSMGLHNLSFTVGILKASIEDVKVMGGPDTDQDGLSDAWEIANFGSIEAQDGYGDPDGDNLNNLSEMKAGINPNAADTDGDNYNDDVELALGHDPNNANDSPAFETRIYTATEFEFSTEAGKMYQVQSITELDDTWVDEGDPIQGDGNMVQEFFSTRPMEENGKRFFRVLEMAPGQ